MKTRSLVKLVVFLLALLVAQPALRAGKAEGDGPPEDAMTIYYLGLIYRGDKWTPERTEETAEIQRQHLANIDRLAQTGELLLAGPFADDGDLRGIFLFQVDSMEKARELVETDPAVKAGRLRVELHPWYGVKGITYPNRPMGEAAK